MKSIGPSQTALRFTKFMGGGAFFVNLWNAFPGVCSNRALMALPPRIRFTLAQVRGGRTEAMHDTRTRR